MDTHITSAPALNGIAAPLGTPVRLPGGRGSLPHVGIPLDGADEDTVGSDQATPPGVTRPHENAAGNKAWATRRNGLVATAALLTVLVGTGGTMWLQRQGVVNLSLPASIHAMLKPGLEPTTGQSVSEVGGPAVSMKAVAATPAPVHAGSAAAPASSPAAAEFASLKNGDVPAEVGIMSRAPVGGKPDAAKAVFPPLTAAGSSMVVGPPIKLAGEDNPQVVPTMVSVAVETPALNTPPAAATVPMSASSPSPPLVSPPTASAGPTAALTSPAASIPVPPAVPAAKPRDPVQTAIDLRAEPLSPRQQVEAVGLVRELGAQLKDTRILVAQLSTTVADLKQQLEARTTEFDGRLTLAEAGTVLAESARAGNAAPPPSPLQPVGTSRVIAVGSNLVAKPVSAAPLQAAARTVKDFRIQGASPGLAVLNLLNPASGDTPVIYVALGDQVPGLGRIKSIYQRGTTWVVQTDGGLIQ